MFSVEEFVSVLKDRFAFTIWEISKYPNPFSVCRVFKFRNLHLTAKDREQEPDYEDHNEEATSLEPKSPSA